MTQASAASRKRGMAWCGRQSDVGLASIDDQRGHAKLVAERRIELLFSRLSIECFEPTKLLRNGAEKRNRTADLLRTEQALYQLSYFRL